MKNKRGNQQHRQGDNSPNNINDATQEDVVMDDEESKPKKNHLF